METTREQELERYEYFFEKESERAWNELSEIQKLELTQYSKL
tara:strand:- start:4999 stop:5124 length:126 start_codon:yes stop_codon:yes gene_type:complete